MQITETLSDGLKREYRIVVEASEMTSRIDARFTELKNTSRLKGFRPGKVPMDLLRKQFGNAVVQEVLQDTVKNTSEEVLGQQEIRQAMPATVQEISFGQGKDLEYVLAVEILPDITPADFSKVVVERYAIDARDEDIDAVVEKVRDACGTAQALGEDTGISTGDRIRVDLELMLDGEKVEEYSGEAQEFVLGEDRLPDEVRTSLEGRRIGESFEVPAILHEDLFNGEHAGEEALFCIKVVQAERLSPHPLDDTLAGKFAREDVDGLRSLARQETETYFSSLSHSLTKRLLLDRLAETHSFDVPPSFVDNEFEAVWKQIAPAFEARGEDSEADEENLSEKRVEYRAIAERRIRLGMLLTEVGRNAGIEVTQQDILQTLVRQTSMFPGQEAAVVRHYQENPEKLRHLTAPIMEERVVDHILEQVVLEERTADLQAFLKVDNESVQESTNDEAPDTDGHIARIAGHILRNLYKQPDSQEVPDDAETSRETAEEVTGK